MNDENIENNDENRRKLVNHLVGGMTTEQLKDNVFEELYHIFGDDDEIFHKAWDSTMLKLYADTRKKVSKKKRDES